MMGCGCGTGPNRTKWGISILLFVAAFICCSIAPGIYFKTLAHSPKSAEGMSPCAYEHLDYVRCHCPQLRSAITFLRSPLDRGKFLTSETCRLPICDATVCRQSIHTREPDISCSVLRAFGPIASVGYNHRLNVGVCGLLVGTWQLVSAVIPGERVRCPTSHQRSKSRRCAGCANCIQDFVSEVLHSVNVKDIEKKFDKIHQRNEREHPGRNDECITENDIRDLLPDFEDMHIPDWETECKESCTPVMKMLPLAMAFSASFMCISALCAIVAFIPLCMLCCCSKDKPAPVYYVQAPPGVSGAPVPYSMPVRPSFNEHCAMTA
jgi:hypothetical protein